MPTVLFICTGNTCRSPMAEYLFKKMLQEKNISGWKIKSAGIDALEGIGPSQMAVAAMREEGIDLAGHQAKSIDRFSLSAADVILTMTYHHREILLKIDPSLDNKTYTLKEFIGINGNLDISDPFGSSIAVYREIKDEIKKVLRNNILVKLNQFINQEGNNEITANNIIGGRKMKIAIGSDHAGYGMKQEVNKLLTEKGIEYQDMGTDSTQSVDYPDYAYKVATGVASGDYKKGILICGTGIGMSISANKVEGIRAALCHDVFSARATRNHNNSNVLTMGARVIGVDLALEIVKTWLGADFDGGRHERRVNKMTAIERGEY